jgi:hypothetical protein
MEGTVASDSGAQIRDGIKSVATTGFCPETDWPYNIAKFTAKPPPIAYTDASKDLATSYQRVPRVLNQMKGCLASGYPFVFGFSVYQSFESPQPATFPCPPPRKSKSAGTLSWLLATTIQINGFLSEIPGEPAGE